MIKWTDIESGNKIDYSMYHDTSKVSDPICISKTMDKDGILFNVSHLLDDNEFKNIINNLIGDSFAFQVARCNTKIITDMETNNDD